MKEFAREIIEGIDEDVVFDQPCKFGCRVNGHAVYCHNEEWNDKPRKCRHTWYYGKDKKGIQDKDCEGYEPNPKMCKFYHPDFCVPCKSPTDFKECDLVKIGNQIIVDKFIEKIENDKK